MSVDECGDQKINGEHRIVDDDVGRRAIVRENAPNAAHLLAFVAVLTRHISLLAISFQCWNEIAKLGTCPTRARLPSATVWWVWPESRPCGSEGSGECEFMAESMDVQPPEDSGEGSGACRIPPISPAASRPTCVICLGMAGSGKTTFVQVWGRFYGHCNMLLKDCGSQTLLVT